MALIFPKHSLNAYGVRLTCYSLALAVAAITKSPIQEIIKPIAGFGMGVSSTIAIFASQKNRYNNAVDELENEVMLNLAADRVTATETIESERIRERLTVELKNSQARVSEWD